MISCGLLRIFLFVSYVHIRMVFLANLMPANGESNFSYLQTYISTYIYTYIFCMIFFFSPNHVTHMFYPSKTKEHIKCHVKQGKKKYLFTLRHKRQKCKLIISQSIVYENRKSQKKEIFYCCLKYKIFLNNFLSIRLNFISNRMISKRSEHITWSKL